MKWGAFDAGLQDTEVLLDNQADISIVMPELLRDMEKVEREIQVSGIRGTQLVVDQKGYQQDFFHVYSSDKAKVNV